MLICLEGVDGSGKTTLAQQLAYSRNVRASHHDCDLFLLHFSQPEQHPLAEYEAQLDFYRPDECQDVICDRYHWGEMIYSELYRGGSQLGNAGFWHVEQYLRSRGGLMVHVTAPLETVRERLAYRGEDYLEAADVANVRRSFQVWRDTSYNEPFVAVSPVPEDTVHAIIVQAGLREVSAKRVKRFPGYIGPLDPHLLLVGERPNVNAKTVAHEAPFLPYPATSGKWLIDNVVLQASRPSTIGLVNAFDRDGNATALRELYHRLDQPRVVALGTAAWQQCVELDVPHTSVPHPSFWKRFHASETEKYRDMVLGSD